MSSTSSTNLAWIVSSGRKSCAHDASKFTHEMDELVPRYVLHNLANISHRMPGSNMIQLVISQKSRFRINLNFGHLIINVGQVMSNTLAPEYQAPKHELPCRCNFVKPNFSDFETPWISEDESTLKSTYESNSSSNKFGGNATPGRYFTFSWSLLMISVSLRPSTSSSWTHISTRFWKSARRWQLRAMILAIAPGNYAKNCQNCQRNVN